MPPIGAADYRDGTVRAALLHRPVVGGRKRSTSQGLDAEQAVEIAGHIHAPDLFAAPIDVDSHAGRAECRHAFEAAGPAAEEFEAGVWRTAVSSFGSHVLNEYQAAGVANRQEAEHNGIHQPENGGVGADTEGKREDRDG